MDKEKQKALKAKRLYILKWIATSGLKIVQWCSLGLLTKTLTNTTVL